MGIIDKVKGFIFNDNNEYEEEMDEGYTDEDLSLIHI